MISAPHWAEVRYIVERKVGPSEWLRWGPGYCVCLNIVPADQELSELAGELKVVKKISLVDCFGRSPGKRENAEIYTGDPEFKTVAREIKLVWFVGASCGQRSAIHSHDCPDFGRRRFPMYSAVNVFLN